MRVFVDYDGTIANCDTFDALVEHFAGEAVMERLDDDLHSGRKTLREVLAAQALALRCTLDEADDFLRAHVRLDPAFAHFAVRCAQHDVPLCILSSGLRPLIERMLRRHRLERLPLHSNDVTPSAQGWCMRFVDQSDWGHDKSAAVRAAQERGEHVVFIGDGISDLSAALVADRAFAKRGRTLERMLRERGARFETFTDFAEIESALF